MRIPVCAFLLFLMLSPIAVGDTPATQQEAISALRGIPSNLQKNRDGTVRFVRFSKAIVTDEHVARVAAFEQLDYLAVIVPAVGDEGLKCVENLTNLDTLFLSDSGVTDATLSRLGKLQKLERLYLDRTQVTDSGLAQLHKLASMKTLSLNGTKISDNGLQQLAKVKNLEVLHLAETAITDGGLKQLSALTNLTELSLNGTQVSTAGVTALVGLDKLKSLHLQGASVVGDLSEAVRNLPALEAIDLRQTKATVDDISGLSKKRKRFTVSNSPSADESRNPLQRYLAGETLRRGGALQKGRESFSDELPTEDVDAPSEKDSRPSQGLHGDATPDFQRHIIPLLGRLGCNGRTCHGSFQGKGGFSLSMFGYDFEADRKALTEGDESRVSVTDPAASLILNKPTSDDDHGGGKRFERDGWEYQNLHRWIQAGANGVDAPAKLLRFEVTPAEIVFAKAGETRQLKCVAVWQDGTKEDVTKLTRFQTNDETVAEVSGDGLITCCSPGDTYVVSFYDNGIFSSQVLMPVSDRTGDHYPEVEAPTEIDRLVVRKLSRMGIVPSTVCSDAEFLRRVSLDLAGTLPSPAELHAFLEDPSPEKRLHKVDELLNSDAYATWWAVKLADLTGSNSQSLGSTDMNSPASSQWNAWLKRRLIDNVGWDRIAAGIILATSRRPDQTWESYAAEQSLHMKRKNGTDFTDLENPMHYYWFRSNNQTDTDRALTFGYTFMGVRLQCAQCHKHPFDQWSKQDFEKFAAFFNRIKTGIAPDGFASQSYLKTKLGVPKKLDTAALRRQMYLRVSAEGLPIPWNEVWLAPAPEKPVLAKIPGGEQFDLNEFTDPREPLMEWLTRKDNPYFAPAFVNRVWAHYFGIGIVDPPDDFNMANPPSNKPLLKWLSDQFIENGYDIKWLHRTIATSATYQRSSVTTATNRTDVRNFSHSLVRRMPAEATVDAILRSTARDDIAAKYLTAAATRKIGQHPKSYQARGIDYSLLVFGKPRRTTSCDCERQDQPTLLQSLFVRNDTELIGWLERSDGWLAAVAKEIGQPLVSDLAERKAAAEPPQEGAFVEDQQTQSLITQAYQRTLTRPPTDKELETAVNHIQTTGSTIEGLRDVLWALVNTQEFLTNH